MPLATNTKRDYYEVLGVTRTATDVEIKSAYRKLAMRTTPTVTPTIHTRRSGSRNAAKPTQCLATADKRSRYDQFGHAGLGGQGGFGGFDASNFQDFSDIFSDLFGFADAFGGGGGAARARSVATTFEKTSLLTFEEAVFGVTKKVNVRHRETCSQCHGSGAAPGKLR